MAGKWFRILFFGMVIMGAASQSGAFSSATHLYIADQVFQSRYPEPNPDLYYGSFAPDLDFFVKPGKWLTATGDTHYSFVDIRPYASNPDQMAFAEGWLTHNEKDPWGADHYAHVDPGYVVKKAERLTGVNTEFAHRAVEVAVDLLLKNDDPGIGEKLLDALKRHPWKDRAFLMEVFGKEEKRTDRLTVMRAEMDFRRLMIQYGKALVLPPPNDLEALAEWGVQLARKLYGLSVSPDYIRETLEDTIDLCKDDYKEAVDQAIQGMKDHFGLP